MIVRAFAIILAAGKSERFGEKKIFKKVKGINVIDFSIAKFLKFGVEAVFVTLQNKDIGKMKKKFPYVIFVEGGETRWDSFQNAFSELKKRVSFKNDDLIIEHDAARPLFSLKMLKDLVENVKDSDGVIPFIKPVDTVRTIGEGNYFVQEIPRDHVALIQTPQIFKAKVIEKMLERNQEKFTDLAGLVLKNGGKIKGIEGERKNIKITFREDLKIIQSLVERKDIILIKETLREWRMKKT